MSFYEASSRIGKKADTRIYYITPGCIGDLKLRLQDYETACEYFRVAIEGTREPLPSFAAFHGSRLAVALARLGQKEQARQEMKIAWETLQKNEGPMARVSLYIDEMTVCALIGDKPGYDLAQNKALDIIKYTSYRKSRNLSRFSSPVKMENRYCIVDQMKSSVRY